MRTFTTWALVPGLGSAGCRRVSNRHGSTSTAGDNPGGARRVRSTVSAINLPSANGSG